MNQASLNVSRRSAMPVSPADGSTPGASLTGAVVRRGITHGIPTLVHQTIVACLSVHQPSASTTPETHARSAIRA